mgnify:FL=1
MKGLLVKDMKLILQNKTMLAVLVIIEAVFFVMQGADSMAFVMAYMMMGYGMLALSTVTLDEHDKSMAFLMAMPVSRKDYALEKYALTFLCMLVGCLVAFLPYCLLQPEKIDGILTVGMGIAPVLVVIQMVALPAQIKFGGERGRIVLVCIFAVVVLVMAASEKIGKQYGGQPWLQDLAKGISDGIRKMGMAGIFGISAAVCAACFWISFMVSKRIMEKKEF